MSNSTIISEESKDKKTSSREDIAKDLIYAAFKSVSRFGLKAISNLEIDGQENVPLRGKAILLTISDNSMRDMFVISQVSGRKIHFMVSPKLMKHQIAGPLLKALEMFRSTTSKDDYEPIQNIFKFLNEQGDLVAMTPESKHERDIQIKSVASIVKFAVLSRAPIIPMAICKTKTKLFDVISTGGLKLRVGRPITCDRKLSRPKYRNKRYELAEDIVNIIDTLKTVPDF
ncbi:MAG: lysophospholipid acyltransferase family protein [Promethearchaeota archaeon]